MQRLRMAFVAGASLVGAVSAAGAQMRVANPVPASMMPPAGMCRVWLPGVTPMRQPAPTDCATARAQAPAGSRIVVGPTAAGLRTGQSQGGFDPRRETGTSQTRTSQGGFDPRRDTRRDTRGGQYDPRYDPRNRDGGWDRDGRDRDWDRLSEKERRKLEKKREKEQRKRAKALERGSRGRDDDDSDSDSDGDSDKDRGRRDGRNRDDRTRDGRSSQDGRWDPRTRTGTGSGWPGRVGTGLPGTGTGTGGCIDVNRDGVCDNGRRP